MSYVWISLTVVMLVIECLTTQLTCIWMSISAAVVAILTALFPALPIPVQILIFILLSGALLAATRPLVRNFLRHRKGGETNLDRLIGETAIVVEPINNILGQGRVKIQGNYWSARSADGSDIPVDTLVTFTSIEGNKAIVSKK